MKSPWVLAAVLGLVAAGALRAAEPAKGGSVEVIFDHPENFTDVKDSSQPTEKGREAILEQLRKYIVDEAGHFLPETFTLKITFTDIDLAGDFEPWRGPEFDNIRVVKPIYPPAFKFSYTVTDPTGRVVKQAEVSIRDLGFESRTTLEVSDPLRYEKDILHDWMRENLQGIK